MKYIITIICLFVSFVICAQDTAASKEASSGLRADGKIYVVGVVALTILIGFVIYLITLDRKISRLEKQDR
jgi:CcmD family protein